MMVNYLFSYVSVRVAQVISLASSYTLIGPVEMSYLSDVHSGISHFFLYSTRVITIAKPH
jgi:hypothetical protein